MNTREVLDKEDFIKKHKDIPGEKHGKLTLLATKPIRVGESVPLENSSKKVEKATRTMYNVQCDCGKNTWVTISHWRNMNAKSCGKCLEPEIGKVYGKLTVIEEAPSKPRLYKNGKTYMRRFWRCKCECGNESIVAQDHLVSGHTVSCGRCMENNIERITESVFEKLTRVAWGIITRCRYPSSKAFYAYGGRGVECRLGESVSEVAVSLSKVPGYFKGAQIDRIDNDGHYVLENLRWVTPEENTRNTILYQHLTKDEVSLRLLPLSTFKKICTTNDMNMDDFSKYDLRLATTQYANDPVYLFIHKDNINDVDYYVKRILNFWAKWTGVLQTAYLDTGLVTTDPTTGEEIKLHRVVSSDPPENKLDENKNIDDICD